LLFLLTLQSSHKHLSCLPPSSATIALPISSDSSIVPGVFNNVIEGNSSNRNIITTPTNKQDSNSFYHYNNYFVAKEEIDNMQESAEVKALKEHYDTIMKREAYRYQQRIDALVQQLEEERKRNGLLEAELVQHLRNQSSSSSTSPMVSLNNYGLLSSMPDVSAVNNISASIVDARELKEKDGGRKYTAYVINVGPQDGTGWTLYKRYRNFEVLHTMLVRRFVEDVPEFPPKHELISSSVKIPKRKAALQQYCNELLSNPQYRSFGPVLDFFKPDNSKKDSPRS